MLRSLLTVSLVLGLAAFAQADLQSVSPGSGDGVPGFGTFPAGDIIFDNIGPNGGYTTGAGSPASQLDPGYPFDSGAADDFTMNDAYFIEDVHWVGAFFTGTGGPNTIQSFNIIIWPDANGVPAGGTPVGNPPDYNQALAFYDIAGNANQMDNGDGTNSYWVDLPVPFETTAGTTYWLEVQAVFPFAPQWAFQHTFGEQGNHAVQGFDFLDLAFWSPVAGPGDMAFQLTGTLVPEPATLMLLGCGTLVLIRRRR